MMKRIVWAVLLSGLGACMDPAVDSKLKLVNGSDKPMIVCYTVDGANGSVNGLTDYNPFHEIQEADTTRGYRAGLLKDSPYYIAPGGRISAHLGMGSWEGHIGTGKLWVYIFAPETVLHTDWHRLRTQKKWRKVYSLTLEQVEARDWVITL